MKYVISAAILFSFLCGAGAMASGRINQVIGGGLTAWNSGESTALYLGGDAAQELYNNLQSRAVAMTDENGQPTGAFLKNGKNIVCIKEVGTRYQCNIYVDNKTGATSPILE